jgi:hypothetical protein
VQPGDGGADRQAGEQRPGDRWGQWHAVAGKAVAELLGELLGVGLAGGRDRALVASQDGADEGVEVERGGHHGLPSRVGGSGGRWPMCQPAQNRQG